MFGGSHTGPNAEGANCSKGKTDVQITQIRFFCRSRVSVRGMSDGPQDRAQDGLDGLLSRVVGME